MRNKIKLIGAVVATISVVGLAAAPVFAEDSSSGTGSTTTTTKEQLKQKLEQDKERLEQEREQKIEKLKDARKSHEQDRIKGLQQVAKNQIDRAQKEEDRLVNVLSRLKALRGKMTATVPPTTASDAQTTTPAPGPSAADLAKIDGLIAKAEALKTKIDSEIADAKAKQTAIGAALPKVEDSIDSTTTENSQVLNTAAPTPIVTSVKDFQASILKLKKDLILFHNSLQDISKTMRKAMHANDDSDEKTTTPTPPATTNNPTGTNTGEQENQ